MGFVRIFWKKNIQEAFLPKTSIVGQIVFEILAQSCSDDSIQILLNLTLFITLGTKSKGWFAFNGFHCEISLFFFFFELRTLISAVIELTHLLAKQSEIPKVISPYACNLPCISETNLSRLFRLQCTCVLHEWPGGLFPPHLFLSTTPWYDSKKEASTE